MGTKNQEDQTTTQDTNIENQLQKTENTLRIWLRVDEQDGNVGIECNYNKASTNLMLQAIAYMIDTAYKGDKDTSVTVAKMIPDIVEEYFRLKEAQEEVDKAEEDVNQVIQSMTEEAIRITLKEELSKPKLDTDFVMRLSSELMRREVQNDRQGKKEKTDDSVQ